MVMSKEQVFEIMGSYYGHAYWRDAVGKATVAELEYITEILDKINALGYNFSNLHRLTDHEDIRFIPIVLEYVRKNNGLVSALLAAFHCRSYHAYTPDLIELYKDPSFAAYRWDIGNALLLCRHKKYIPQYLEIVRDPAYGDKMDLIMEILCHYKVKEAFPRLLELYEQNTKEWVWTLLKYGWYFQDKRLISYIEPYLACDDGELRRMAKKALEKLITVDNTEE